MAQPIGDEYSALQGLRILMVDDDEDSCEILTVLFRLYGAKITTCCSVKEALERLAVLQPQVLLSDIAMPRQDGYVLIQAIRALRKEQGGQIPAIALTGFADKTTQQQVLNAGFDRHVAKPIDPFDLAHVVINLFTASPLQGVRTETSGLLSVGNCR
ncbi:MAG TPA: response regulator [Candidatus Sericytochromatia bacterium]